jgi:hypothetical protein
LTAVVKVIGFFLCHWYCKKLGNVLNSVYCQGQTLYLILAHCQWRKKVSWHWHSLQSHVVCLSLMLRNKSIVFHSGELLSVKLQTYILASLFDPLSARVKSFMTLTLVVNVMQILANKRYLIQAHCQWWKRGV